MKKLSLLCLIVLFSSTSCSTLRDLGIAPTGLETINALKKVLDSSAFKAIKTLQKMNKNGAESLLPKELHPVLGTLKSVGLGNEVDKVSKKIGEVSAVVVKESGSIMKDAIRELKFSDAVSVVTGGEGAATRVLKQSMYGVVKKRYSARLETELDKTQEINQYWPMAAGAYNLFSKKKVDGSLSDFMAERAVDVVFLQMEKEEKEIRKNPSKLRDAAVTKVFNYYSKKQKKK